MRNWPKELQPASFNGFPFWVERAALPKSGRAIATHQFVKAETHATEDMGRLPREFRVTAYLASDMVDVEARALIDVCSTPGAFMLNLPIFGGNMVRCRACNPTHEKSKMGFVGFELDFIEAGQDGAGFGAAVAIGDRIAASALDGLSGLVSNALSSFTL